MNYTKYNTESSIDENKLEFTENKVFSWLNKFWRFSFFYGDYLAGLHSQKRSSTKEIVINK